MTFGAQESATDGSIAPARLSLQLLHQPDVELFNICDHNGQAQLAPAGADHFEGKTNAGQDVALTRQ